MKCSEAFPKKFWILKIDIYMEGEYKEKKILLEKYEELWRDKL